MPSPHHARFALDPAITFLNHGSFGACPREALEAQSAIRARMEAEPVRFFVHEAPPMLDAARETIARELGARPEDLVFVRNASEGVATILAARARALAPGDELLTTDHAYPACKNALDHLASRTGAIVTVARVPFPLSSAQQVIDAITSAVTPRTKLALLDHVTSPTGLVFPIAEIVAALRERGVETLVDGAHAPGMLDVDLDALGAAYYTGNLHKWMCAPKGCAILHIRRDLQDGIHPLVISHGLRSTRPRPRLWEEFDWTGTDDPSAFLAAPAALSALASMLPGGLPALRDANRALALHARDRLCATLGIAPPAPDSMIGALAAVPLPDAGSSARASAFDVDPLGLALLERHAIEIPLFPWPAPPRRLLRIACQIYVDRDDVERLCAALRSELAGVAR
ncbi:MAG: aminotransferase class V-fold PLP-dependent enzyme [Myxococcota bacterium]|nr:aminotransferase class V-fold PLP-dependent enzyme [Myxococcota bacterium]